MHKIETTIQQPTLITNIDHIAAAAEKQGAVVEVWSDQWTVIAAPDGKCWQQNEMHKLAGTAARWSNLLQGISAGLINCPEDCPFHGTERFKPSKPFWVNQKEPGKDWQPVEKR